MIEVDITEEQRDRAYDISNPGKVFNQNKTGARAGFIGALGEIVVSDYLGIEAHVYDEELEVYDYDIMYNYNIRGQDVENVFHVQKLSSIMRRRGSI